MFDFTTEDLIEARELYGTCLNNCQYYNNFSSCPCYKMFRNHWDNPYKLMDFIRRTFNINHFIGAFCFRYDKAGHTLSEPKMDEMIERMELLLVSLDNLIAIFSLIDEIRLSEQTVEVN